MQFLASAPHDGYEVCFFQNDEMFGYCLACHFEVPAKLAQGLPVFLKQFVEQLASARVGQSFEDFIHDTAENMQLFSCMSSAPILCLQPVIGADRANKELPFARLASG
jgi:hypothetical protein